MLYKNFFMIKKSKMTTNNLKADRELLKYEYAQKCSDITDFFSTYLIHLHIHGMNRRNVSNIYKRRIILQSCQLP